MSEVDLFFRPFNISTISDGDVSSSCMLRQHLLSEVSVLITWSAERARPFSCFRFSAILQK